MEFERSDSGRIKLSDFYRAGLQSRFFFTETQDYLRALGAIDDTDDSVGPKVIISNYVLAKSNCLAQSHVYNICCINECENVYGHIEQQLSSSLATPDRILALVSQLSTSTVHAPRAIPQSLVLRLQEIAAGNHGEVSLHGRLFAQWMHHAFPRECPYPHRVGTTTSLSPTAFKREMKQDISIVHALPQSEVEKATMEHIEMLDASFAWAGHVGSDNAATDMWTDDEEHFVEPKRSFRIRLARLVNSWSTLFPVLAVLGVLAGVAVAQTSPKESSGSSNSMAKYFV